MAQVPLAEDRRGMPSLLIQFGQGQLGVGDSDLRGRTQGSGYPHPIGIASGQQGRPGGGAHRLGHVEVRTAHALRR